jgi:hypothetical protein
MSLLQPFLLLVRLRAMMTARTYLRGGSALVGVALALLVCLPAALAAGTNAERQLTALPTPENEYRLRLILLAAQGLWLLLLLPGSGAALSQATPIAVLRPFPVRPDILVIAAACGALLDLPLLLVLPTFAGVGRAFAASSAAVMIVLVLALVLMAVQTALLGQLLEQAAALLSRQRRLLVGFVAVLGLLFGFYGALPAVAAPTTPAKRNAVHPAPPFARSAWMYALPSGLTAHIAGAASRGEWGGALLALLGMATYTVLTFKGASRLLQTVSLREGVTATATGPTVSLPLLGRRTRELSDTPPTAWDQIREAARTELRNLVRNPASHLPLRQPASLLFTLAFAWIAPNLGPDPIGNMTDLLGMGSLMYVVAWQVQIATNRFGNEAGTASLLLSFPVSRARMMVGRNLALAAFLLIGDGAVVVGITRAAEKPHLLVPLLLWLPVMVLLLTAFGNVLSVLSPFAIVRKKRGFEPEPERSIAFVYILVITAVGCLIWGCVEATYVSPLAGIAALAGVAGLYAMSIPIAAWLLKRRERQIIATLDGNG